MLEIKSGRTVVYEVGEQYRPSLAPHVNPDCPYPTETSVHAATFWERNQAGIFLHALAGIALRAEEWEAGFLYNNTGQRRIDVVVAGDEVFHAVNKDGIPITLIYSSATEAARDYLASRQDVEDIRPGILELATS